MFGFVMSYFCHVILTLVLMVYYFTKYHLRFILLSVFYGNTITSMALEVYEGFMKSGEIEKDWTYIFHKVPESLPEQVCNIYNAQIFISSKIFH